MELPIELKAIIGNYISNDLNYLDNMIERKYSYKKIVINKHLTLYFGQYSMHKTDIFIENNIIYKASNKWYHHVTFYIFNYS